MQEPRHGSHQDRLDDPLRFDGGSQLFERLRAKLGARLHAAAANGGDGHRPDAGAVEAARLLRTEERIETSTQTLTLDAHAARDYPLQSLPSMIGDLWPL